MAKKNEDWKVTEKPSEINRNWVKSLFERKDKETLEECIKNKPRRDMRAFQRRLLKKALRHNPLMTAGNFAKHHNTILRRLK